MGTSFTVSLPCIFIFWLARRDSNPQPRDYESPALTIELQAIKLILIDLVHRR